jgi:ferredoxin
MDTIIEVDESLCIDCGHCVAVCPTGAMGQRSMGPEDCGPIDIHLIPRGAPCVIQACARKDERAAPPAAMIAIARIKLAHPAFIEAMGLPDGCIPFGTFVIGYPAARYQRIPKRRPIDVTWRREVR